MRRIAAIFTVLMALAGPAPVICPAFAQAPSAVPALPDSERRIAYAVSSSTGPLAVPFAIYGDGTDYSNWIEVWVNGVKLTGITDWQLTLTSGTVANSARPLTNAQISFTTAQTGTVQIVGARRPRRVSQFAENRGVAARDLNQAFTDVVAMLREGWDKVNDTSGRTLQAPPGESLAVLPTSSTRSGRYPKFDANGNMVAGATEGAVEGATVASLAGTATDSRVIQTGSVSFTTQASRQWLVGTYLTISNSSDGSAYMHGPVTAYDSGSGAVTINSQDTSGSGSYNSWNLSVAGTRGTQGPTGPVGTTTIAGVPTTSHFAIFGPTPSTQISDGGTNGYGLSWNYTTLKVNTTSPPAAFGAPLNAKLTATVSSNALTIALKDGNGSDPTSASPAMVPFRSANPAVSDVTWAEITAATTVSITSGSTLGFTNLVPGRIWVVGFYDAGTFRLGAIQNLSGTSIYPLGGWGIASSTAEGGAGAADTSQTFYTGTAVSAKSYAVLGYLTWETGLANAGLWTAAPDRIQMFGPSVKLPGEVVQTARNPSPNVNTGTTTVPADDTIPQNTEGDQYLLQNITPRSAANLLRISHIGQYTSSVSTQMTCALFQDATANALAATNWFNNGGGNPNTVSLSYWMVAGTTSPTAFKIRAGGAGAGTTTYNGTAGARLYGGVMASHLTIDEIMN